MKLLNVKIPTKFLKKLGPGLLFAGTAIGVSHLVQSTKAGAEFGFGLVWALIIAIILKYPFNLLTLYIFKNTYKSRL